MPSFSAKNSALSRVQAEADTAAEKNDDQQALQKSEEMMRAFLTATGGEEEDSSKTERTKTIIKTVKVQTHNTFIYQIVFSGLLE